MALMFAALLFLCCSTHTAQYKCSSRLTHTEFNRKGFVSATYGQEAEVAAEFLAAQGCNESMLAALGKLGAKVKYSDTKVNYVLATLPKENLLAALDIQIDDATIPRIPYSEDDPYFAADEADLTVLWKQFPRRWRLSMKTFLEFLTNVRIVVGEIGGTLCLIFLVVYGICQAWNAFVRPLFKNEPPPIQR